MIKAYWKTDWFLGLVVTLLFLLTTSTDLMREIEFRGYDLGARFASTKPANQDVVVVAIDDPALQELGAWPWPRDVLAQATRKLSALRPSVIGFALPLDTEQHHAGLEYLQKLKARLQAEGASSRVKRLLRTTESRMNTDSIFANRLRSAGRVVLAMPYIVKPSRFNQSNGVLADYLNKFTFRDVTGIPDPEKFFTRFLPEPVPVINQVYPPIEQLAQYAGGAGVINMGSIEQDYARVQPLVVRYGGSYLPSFTLMMAARNQRLATREIKVDLGQTLEMAGERVKTDSQLRIYPRFYRGKDDEPAFKVYSILDVLNGNVGRSDIGDKTVLVGLTANQLVSPLITPIGEVMAPVMVEAHTVSSLLNDELFDVPEWTGWLQKLAIVLIGLYLMFVLPRFRMGTGFALTALLAIGVLNVHFITMLSESIWIPLMAPLLVLILGHVILGAKHFLESHLEHVYVELSEANQALGQSFHSQGQLDQAFDKYRKCRTDSSLLNQLYNLGLDYERKRQFNKAVSVFKYIEAHNPDFSDVKERLSQNQEVSNAMLGGNKGGPAPDGTLIISNPGVQKPMLGRYQIDRELGRGAMGMVYLGHDPKIGRTVAIKTMSLSQEFEGEKLADVKERFFREAETAGRLNHPNIVTIYDVGEDQELSYIAMDFLKGENLMEYCKAENKLPAKEIFDIVIQAAEALDYAHGEKVVHRDIKPANMLYDREAGIVKVTDFGVACLTDTSKTKTGTILGSPSYMSPEQLAGVKVDGRSDLFSLGVTLYQLLCSELPFIADSLASLMYKIANEKHPDIRMFRPDLPSCVSQIINKSLHKDIERRFQSGSQMAKALTRCSERLTKKH